MVKQNTQEWLDLRQNHIGASDAPIIMGNSPWSTPLQLWEQKLGLSERFKGNYATQRGQELEPVALEAYNAHTGNCATPEVVFCKDRPWMMASLDGLSLCRGIPVEIKCPGEADHQTAKAGQVPEKYYAQLQHQLAVIDAPMAHYFSFRSESDWELLEVARDEKYIGKLLKKELAFWNCMRDFAPPALSDRDYAEREDAEWLQVSAEWLEAKAALDEAKAKEALLKANLTTLAGDRNCKGGGVKVQKIIRKGSVDYKAVPELAGVDLEQYRKAAVVAWKVST